MSTHEERMEQVARRQRAVREALLAEGLVPDDYEEVYREGEGDVVLDVLGEPSEFVFVGDFVPREHEALVDDFTF